MTTTLEVELKFLVPAASQAALVAEMARGAARLQRTTLAASYLDTDDRRLARAGMAWRLRREGRQWVQALKAAGANALERFEHEMPRPDGTPDASVHAGTPVGDRLIALLREARAEGVEPRVRYQTQVRRLSRRVRTRGAVVEIALDDGRLRSSGASVRIREVEFELVSGSVVAMLALVERWRRRFGLVFDPRSKAERGDRLAEGSPFPAVRKAAAPAQGRQAGAREAFGAVLDECLAQITRNAVGLADGDPALRVEHVHQLRVGMRRLRSALRAFRGWVPPPPPDLVDALRALFATLGRAREADVLGSGVGAELAAMGLPAQALAGAGPSTRVARDAAPDADPVAEVRADEAQRMLLGWIAWRASLADAADADTPDADGPSPAATAAPPDDAAAFQRRAARRLRRWHARLLAHGAAFDGLDAAGLHALRKRIKRQRYALEFFAPGLRRKSTQRCLAALADLQERMGLLTDLFTARARCHALAADAPAVGMALHWLDGRIAPARASARTAFDHFARRAPPACRRAAR